MPIYEFCCNSCDHQFELLQKVSDPLPSECPNCDKAQIQKLVSATSFRLKGSGWYETDFKDKSKPKPKSETKDDASSQKSDKKDTKSTTTTSSSKVD